MIRPPWMHLNLKKLFEVDMRVITANSFTGLYKALRKGNNMPATSLPNVLSRSSITKDLQSKNKY
jgi:hypothetical protein